MLSWKFNPKNRAYWHAKKQKLCLVVGISLVKGREIEWSKDSAFYHKLRSVLGK